MPSVAQNQIILQGLISNPAQIPNCEAWYDLSDANARITTTANFTGTGTATSTLISTAFVGVATAFLSELAPGDSVYNGSAVLIGVILSVTNDTNAVLTANGAAAITGTAFQISKANPRIILLKDKSGNSEVNVLALNGVNGNYASSPNAVPLQITGDIDLRVQAQVFWTSITTGILISKRGASGQYCFSFSFTAAQKLTCFFSQDGTTGFAGTSSVAPIFSDSTVNWVRVTRASASGNILFYTSQDGVSWTQLGTTVSTTTGAIFNGTSAVEVGSQFVGTNSVLTGNLLRAQIYNGIAGTLVFDANFGTVAKLAASFSESSTNVATVTINTTGDLGARICGARDLVQLTAGKQPTLGSAGTTSANALFDGTNDYMQAASFALIQPETIYFVGTEVAWTNAATLFDGGTSNTGRLFQNSTTPNLALNAGSSLGPTTPPALSIKFLLTVLFNSPNTKFRLNSATPESIGDVGAGNMNGLTLGARGNITAFGNIQAQEIAIYSTAHDGSMQNRVIRFFARRWSILTGA